MAESHRRGAHSSKHSQKESNSQLDREKGTTILTDICERPLFKNIIEALGADSELHLVGGIVRDALLGIEKTDIDIASQLKPAVALEKLAACGFHVVETGIEHGTIVIAAEGQNIELTTFRAPSARNNTSYSETIEQDLSGRDFTINALAFSVVNKKLIDLHGGLSDLNTNTLKAVGSASDRFNEDPLRILRAYRFGSAAGRTLDKEIRDAIATNRELLKSVSPERIRDEFTKILCSHFPTQALGQMNEDKILELIVPEALASVGFEQNEFHIHDVFEHTLWVVDRANNSELLRLAAFFHDLGKPATLTVGEDGRRHFYKHEQVSEEIAREVMKRLKYPKKLTNEVATIVKHHMRPLDCGSSGLRRLMRDLGELFDDWLLFKRADMPPVMPQEEFEEMYDTFQKMLAEERARTALPEYGHLAVNGNDLQQIGIPAGKKLGKILKALEEVVIEDPAKNDKETLLQIAKEINDS